MQEMWKESTSQQSWIPGSAFVLHLNLNIAIRTKNRYLNIVNCSLPKAYDQHLNMILGDVEETVTTVEIDEETYEEIYKVRISSILFTVLEAVSSISKFYLVLC